ncbi:MAG: hypothetical protein RMJ15_10295 [Nitrososphaerota archaeon]|nr:hypothetical protein [Candidatus Bathyarchaeota archaeon]MDW8024104.1 hypothetical protein [Nitrososphaerota archaeon]
MDEKTKRAIRAGIILAFIALVVGLLIYSRIRAYSLAPTLNLLSCAGIPCELSPSFISVTILATHGYASYSLLALQA